MISYIKGTVAYKESDYVVLDHQGIGYQIRTSQSDLSKVQAGMDTTFYTYMYVREDAISLFGFLRREELRTFLILLSVNGVGPRAALSVLSTMSIEELYYAVISDDAKSIARTPGIGPKGAKKMILELKDKLKLEELGIGGDGLVEESSGGFLSDAEDGDSITDTMEALIALGYSNGEAYRAVHSIKGAGEMDSEQLIKEALKKMLG